MAKKHWIYIKRGLSEDAKHRAQMGECIWLYMHIIDRADWETGIAIDWRDTEEAADMGMPVDTLRRQRQKLQELDYIRTKQRQHSQDIYIMEWRNPRDYGSEIKNPRFEGSHEQPPSNSEGLNQGLNEGSNQVQAQVKTPTSTSKSKPESVPALDFKSMNIPEARKVPTLKMYAAATDFFPGSQTWAYVHETIIANNLTEEKIRDAATAWAIKGYKSENVQGILEWAINGIPSNGHKSTDPKPEIKTERIEETKQLIEEKLSGVFVPRPAHVERPVLKGTDHEQRRTSRRL